jgi:hypothetical protein
MDPYYFGKLDPDPQSSEKSEKMDPDLDSHESLNSEAFEAQNGAM